MDGQSTRRKARSVSERRNQRQGVANRTTLRSRIRVKSEQAESTDALSGRQDIEKLWSEEIAGATGIDEKPNGCGKGKMLLRDWLLQQADEKRIQGLEWTNVKGEKLLRVPWVHGSKASWTIEDCRVFESWAKHTGKFWSSPKNTKKWKANFRCAINCLPDVKEVTSSLKSETRCRNCKLYRFLPEIPRNSRKTKEKTQDRSLVTLSSASSINSSSSSTTPLDLRKKRSLDHDQPASGAPDAALSPVLPLPSPSPLPSPAPPTFTFTAVRVPFSQLSPSALSVAASLSPIFSNSRAIPANDVKSRRHSNDNQQQQQQQQPPPLSRLNSVPLFVAQMSVDDEDDDDDDELGAHGKPNGVWKHNNQSDDGNDDDDDDDDDEESEKETTGKTIKCNVGENTLPNFITSNGCSSSVSVSAENLSIITDHLNDEVTTTTVVTSTVAIENNMGLSTSMETSSLCSGFRSNDFEPIHLNDLLEADLLELGMPSTTDLDTLSLAELFRPSNFPLEFSSELFDTTSSRDVTSFIGF